MSEITVYADTSIFGGVFDPEFEKYSRMFFEQVKRGECKLIISPLVEDELAGAPDFVQQYYSEIFPYLSVVRINENALDLQTAYIDREILTPKWQVDALHVAIATVNNCKIITSWNFKHIVHFKKIKLYNAMNLLKGYNSISIHTPSEVLKYEND